VTPELGLEFSHYTAAVLAAVGALLLVSALLSRFGRFGVPVSLLFLAVGMLAGSDGPGGIWFDRFDVAYLAGTAALVIILFAGGLSMPLAEMRRVAAPAAVLATVGVLGIAALTAIGAHAFGLEWREAMLVGAIVSSTDAAAVLALLDGVPLRERVARTLEAESGLNDPVAVILTVAAAGNLAGTSTLHWGLIADILLQLLIGGAFGVAIGGIARWLLPRARLSTPALLPVITVAVALVAYGAATELGGSGFLSVYVAGIVVAAGALPYRSNLMRFHDSLAWLAQIAMFLLLGLLVFPSRLGAVASTGLLLALFVAIVARPLVVTVCLIPFRYAWREIVCIAWLGLRGAMPIILATLPILMSDNPETPVREVLDEFELVFFIVVVGSIMPGMTVRWLPRLLRLEDASAPNPSAAIDITSSVPIHEAQLTFFIAPGSPVAGRTVRELALPEDAAVMLIVRAGALVAPRGPTTLAAGDHAFVLCHPDSVERVHACFAGANADRASSAAAPP
jgi:cell volume regulation protein A